MTELLDKSKNFPSAPGCYLMKNKSGRVIYVGKAKNLKKRVSSYFQAGAKTPKTKILVSHIKEVDFQITETEAEAFVLESNLIKKHSPKYNVHLKDDKSYPYVVIDHSEPYPRLKYQRRPKRKKNQKIYGPFVVGSQIGQVLRVLTKSLRLRDCNLKEFQRRTRPCLLYQLHQCSAPCVEAISAQDYDQDLALAENFFKGKGDELLSYLQEKMQELSEEEKFEHAALLRDYLEVLEPFDENFRQSQNLDDPNTDIIAFHQGEVEVDLSVYMIRNGLLLGHKNFHFIGDEEALEEQALRYLNLYYSEAVETPPDKIVMEVEERKFYEKAFELSLGKKIKFIKPGRKYKKLHELTFKNAFETGRVRIANKQSLVLGLRKLQELLKLKEMPRLLECYDVAIWQGKSPTASRVTFKDGFPDKKNYRHYHLEERPEGNNDFAMMHELMKRRVARGNLPDVMVIDGGKGQVNTVLKALEECGQTIPVVGIAKAKFRQNSEERLIIPGRNNPYTLKRNPSLFRILVQMRDEAHRFSRRLHHKEEKKRLFTSWLDNINGIGEKRKQKILEKIDFPLEELTQWPVEKIKDYLDVPLKLAHQIKQAIDHNKESTS